MRLENRVAIITGAGRGVGKHIALAYAKEGAKLLLAGRTLSDLEETARAVEDFGVETCVIATDIGEQEQVDRMVREAEIRFGTVDILVNNAAMVGPIGPAHLNDVSDWAKTIQVNLIGTYLCCRAVLPLMLKQDRGKIIILSGGGGAFAWRGMSAYGASKVALVRLAETLALDLAGKNVQVNAMRPGGIATDGLREVIEGWRLTGDTDMVEVGERIFSGNAEGFTSSVDLSAELAVFLASDASGDMSGRLINTDDDFANLPHRLKESAESAAYMLRRVES